MNQPKVYDVLPSKGPKEQKIIDAFLRQQTIQNSQTAFQNRILPRDWQVCAASEILDRRDTIVITATGSGKSLTYLLALIANPEKILLGIFPLLSLMTDQVGYTINQEHYTFQLIELNMGERYKLRGNWGFGRAELPIQHCAMTRTSYAISQWASMN